MHQCSAHGWATSTSARCKSAATSSNPSPWRSSPKTSATTCWPSCPNKVYQRLLSTATAIATGLLDSASQSVAGQKQLANVEHSIMTAGLMGETSVTQR